MDMNEEMNIYLSEPQKRITPEIANRILQEAEHHKKAASEKLDENELDAVSGGFIDVDGEKLDRDWASQGCAATCEKESWCWSNDRCEMWSVTYANFHKPCIDSKGHDYEEIRKNDEFIPVIYWKCRKCGKIR